MARKRAEDYEDKRRAILDSAAAVLAEHGMDKASMSLVAQHAAMSKALLYHYYPGKDALIFDIIRTHLEEMDAALLAADDPALAPEIRLRRLIAQVVEHYRDADDRHKVQLIGVSALQAEQAEAIRQIERRITRRFSAALREINPGLAGERPLLMPVTMSIFGMLNWIYMWFRPDGPISREAYADLVCDMLLGGVRGLK